MKIEKNIQLSLTEMITEESDRICANSAVTYIKQLINKFD